MTHFRPILEYDAIVYFDMRKCDKMADENPQMPLIRGY